MNNQNDNYQNNEQNTYDYNNSQNYNYQNSSSYNGGYRRLHRSSRDSKLCGVCGGIAEYFNIDPTIVRLIWVAISFCGGGGIIAYIIAAIIMPTE